ncbi:MAG: hypothetical protein HN402_05700 [Candidatus Scalindua sp.]|nr:hypothetical protein [Candidatus Scalindua sp.]
MVRRNYPGCRTSRGIHQTVHGKDGALIEDYKQKGIALYHEVLDFLSGWF